MKVLIICSKQFYSMIPKIKEELESKGIEVFLPNCYDQPNTEEIYRQLGNQAHSEFKSRMFRQSEEVISGVDAVLVLNLDKEKNGQLYKNYIGGATFLEIYDAWRMGKEIYFYNDIPQGILYDELQGFAPVLLNRNLKKINR